MSLLPPGHRLVLDRTVRRFRGGRVLVGGHPGRILQLTGDGAELVATLVAKGVTSHDGGELGRRLVRAGMAHPLPPHGAGSGPRPDEVTVVVPARDRPELLERCLASLGDTGPVVVVDDASDDPDPVAAVCRRHGARLLVRTENGGPGAARNQAIAATTSPFLAFVDSDCAAPSRWLATLLAYFDDPDVGAVAPRVRPAATSGRRRSSTIARYLAARSSLDLGPDPGEVGVGRPVPYVPTAALIVRRQALDDLAASFDPALRYGEDVDLVWRLVAAGWQVRYTPSVTFSHHEPERWCRLLARRFRYGTSAGPLAARHPGSLPIVELRTWPSVVAVLALTGHLGASVAVAGLWGALLGRKVRPFGVPTPVALRWAVDGGVGTAVGLSRAATVTAGPLVLAATLPFRHGRGAARAARRTRSGRPSYRHVAVLLLCLAPTVDWWRRRPGLDPLRWLVASVADDLAYGAGVWTGCVRAGTFGPLVPAWRKGTSDDDRPETASTR